VLLLLLVLLLIDSVGAVPYRETAVATAAATAPTAVGVGALRPCWQRLGGYC
jgi:hypothetical protein